MVVRVFEEHVPLSIEVGMALAGVAYAFNGRRGEAIRTNVNDGFNQFDRPVTQYRPES
jgi:hypothetical protein